MSEKTALQSNKNISPAFIPTHNAFLQRKCACGGNPGPSGECEECRQKRLSSQSSLIQAKLTIGQSNDKYELEADRVADAVMRMPEPKVQRQSDDEQKEEDDELVQTKPISDQITPLIQRQTVDKEKDEEDETVQTMASSNHMPEVTSTMEANINAMKGGGTPLDPTTRAFMEPRFGHDFSRVRVHTDAKAAESAKSMNALAYTVGRDVVFGTGQYAPGTVQGKRLLSHELTHVIQQENDLSEYPRISLERDSSSRNTGGITANSVIGTIDANVRINNYVEPAKELAKRILSDLESGKIQHPDARTQAIQERNRLLENTRRNSTPGGRAFSRAIKEEGKSAAELTEKYARKVLAERPDLIRKYGLKSLDATSPLFDGVKYRAALQEVSGGMEVSREIIQAAGRTNKVVTGVAKIAKVAGPIGIAVGASASLYEIIKAPEGQTLHVAGREASGFAGGMIGTVGGGLLAGWTASLACGPGAPVCALIVSIAIVGVSAYTGGSLGEKLYEETPGIFEQIGRSQIKCIESCDTLPWYLKGFCLTGCN